MKETETGNNAFQSWKLSQYLECNGTVIWKNGRNVAVICIHTRDEIRQNHEQDSQASDSIQFRS
jgi:hypothetical protein